jgi:hypothetical protein
MSFGTLNVPGGYVTVEKILTSLNARGPKVPSGGKDLEILHKGN